MVLIEALSTLGAGLLGSVGGYEYRRRREQTRKQKSTTETWFDDCLDIIGRGAYNIEQARFGSERDDERILNELDTFSERLFIQARDPPDDVPPPMVEGVLSVAQMYAKATAVADVNTRKEGVEVMSELFELAQVEYSEEVNFEDAIHDAAEVSVGFENMIQMVENSGVGTSELAETMEEILVEWNSEDFEQFILGANEDAENVDHTIEQVIDLFFAIANNLSNNAYEALQSERDQLMS